MRRSFLLCFVSIILISSSIPVTSVAQDNAVVHKKRKKHPTETKKLLTDEERKKAAIRRTLKEKNFHRPDATNKNILPK